MNEQELIRRAMSAIGKRKSQAKDPGGPGEREEAAREAQAESRLKSMTILEHIALLQEEIERVKARIAALERAHVRTLRICPQCQLITSALTCCECGSATRERT